MEIFYNGTVTILSNNNDFTNSYKRNLYSFSGGLNSLIESSYVNVTNFFLWPDSASEALPQMLDSLAICNGITLYEKTSESIKTFAFATDPNSNNIQNFYINNTDILKKIKDQFLLEHQNDIKTIKKFESVVVPSIVSFNNHVPTDIEKNAIFTKYIIIDGKTIVLSPKLMDVLYFLSHGLSVKEIAIRMNISPRTVEKHIEKISIKTEGCSRIDLIRAFWRQNNYVIR
jgi:DNA-binding CsgD family transcriptional regulator